MAQVVLAAAALIGLFAMHGLAEHGLQAVEPATSGHAPAAVAGMTAGMHQIHRAMASAPQGGVAVASMAAHDVNGFMGSDAGGGMGGHLMLTGLCLAVLLLAVALVKTLPAAAWPSTLPAAGPTVIPTTESAIRTAPRHALQVMRC